MYYVEGGKIDGPDEQPHADSDRRKKGKESRNNGERDLIGGEKTDNAGQCEVKMGEKRREEGVKKNYGGAL